jgi:hypothetical protein
MTVTASRARFSDLELHRRQCEARHYARMPGAERVACLERIAKVRGDKAAQQLAENVRAVLRGGTA